MNYSTISVRVNSDDKHRFEEFCNNTGLNVSSAINLYIKAVLMENQIPFTIKNDVPNSVTAAAIAEGEKLAHDPTAKRYTDVDSLRAALEL